MRPGHLPGPLAPLAETGRRDLELEVQWGHITEHAGQLEFDRIERVELRVPVAWGRVECAGSPAIGRVEAKTGEIFRTITWLRPTIAPESLSAGRLELFVRFEDSIDPSGVVQGLAEVRFVGALSGVEGFDLYYPLGGKWDIRSGGVKTYVRTEFSISLASLRYQAVRLVPDPDSESDGDRSATLTFDRVMPNLDTVSALTNAVTESGFYVKRVVEETPRTGGRANIFNRSWDIAGRKYAGVYPVDFHLIISGEEVYMDGIHPTNGSTTTALKVKGLYANAEMEGLIENAWEQLTALIEDTFAHLKQDTATMPETISAVSQPTSVPQKARDFVATLDRLREAQSADAFTHEGCRKLMTALQRAAGQP